MSDAELVPFRVDGSLETERVFVSSEPGSGEGETQDLDGLLHHVSDRERSFERAHPVLLSKGVVTPVHGAVAEVVVRRAHVPNVFAPPCRGVEFQSQWFCALELPGREKQLAYTSYRAADEPLVAEMTGELEVLLEDITRLRLVSTHVESPAEHVAGCCQFRLVPELEPELDRALVPAEQVRLVEVDGSKRGQRPRRVRSVLRR